MENQAEELRGKAKLAFEASLKIFQGQKLANEGTFELNNLFGAHSLKKGSSPKKGGLTPGQKSAITKKKLIAHRDNGFKNDNRTDEQLKAAMINLVRNNRQVSSGLFKKRLHVGDRRLGQLLGQLAGEKVLVDTGSGEKGAHHRWVLSETQKTEKTKKTKKTGKVKKPRKVKEEKHINGHKLAKTPVGGGTRNGHKTVEGAHGGQIDVTDEKLVNKAMAFVKTHDWINKNMFFDAVDLSPKPGNRLLEYLTKQKLVREVKKKNNPAHENVKKIYVQALPYIEAVV